MKGYRGDMSYKEKQRIESSVEVLNKIAVVLYLLAILETAAYVCGLKIGFINLRAIANEKNTVCVVGTALLGFGISKRSNKVKEEFIKKVKYKK